MRKTDKKPRRHKIGQSKRDYIFKRDNYTCRICGYKMHKELTKSRMITIDHIKPLSKGGLDSKINLQTLCFKCNKEKGNN